MIVVSSCLKGDNCRYNGVVLGNEACIKAFETGQLISVCPEELGGLSTPRDPSEISPDGSRRVYSNKGIDVTEPFKNGAIKALDIAKANNCHIAVLKSRSPSCGSKMIYSGDFDGKHIEGEGITAEHFRQAGMHVYNDEEVFFPKLIVHDYLDSHGFEYETYSHVPVFTVDEAKKYCGHIEAQHCKNLFLRNRKGDEYYLVIIPEDDVFDIKAFAKKHQVTKPSFASKNSLFKYLGVEPGSVSVFGLLYDTSRQVQVVFSPKFQMDQKISFHPCCNDETLVLKYSDVMKFISQLGYEVKLL